MSPDDPLFCDRMLLSTRLTGDRKAWSRLVDDAFVGVDAFGVQTDKAQRLAEFDGVIYRGMELKEHRLMPAGTDTAVIVGELRSSGILSGQPFAGTYRYTNVWVRRADGWRLLVSHSTAAAG